MRTGLGFAEQNRRFDFRDVALIVYTCDLLARRFRRFVVRQIPIEPRADEHPTIDDIQSWGRTRLAGYKVPRQVLVVDKVLRSPSGKADYRWARDRASEPVATPNLCAPRHPGQQRECPGQLPLDAGGTVLRQ